MQYYDLFYSRTAARDYRWLSYPSVADRADQAPLDNLFAAYYRYRGAARLARAPVAPLYLVRLSTITALVTCGPTGRVDRHQRPIYSMRGICVAKADTRHLWFALPLLLNQPDGWLPTEHGHNLEDANAVKLRAMKARSLALNEIDSDVSYLASRYQSDFAPTTVNYPVMLSFDVRGLNDLMRCCASPSIPAGDILFGATPEMNRAFPHPIIKAPI